ncbi:unnamed protein product [Thelazia callipaeda]|uniref:Uncharacterized protein n=1 Tax=Thelazia callipaeda TaxID=103827 RepID=A0A0N5CYI3_THECL|nr:unnamed protein product [Thelazia callipaeda]
MDQEDASVVNTNEERNGEEGAVMADGERDSGLSPQAGAEAEVVAASRRRGAAMVDEERESNANAEVGEEREMLVVNRQGEEVVANENGVRELREAGRDLWILQNGEREPNGQQAELNPHDVWLMRAAGAEHRLVASVQAERAAVAAHEDDHFSFEDSERFEEDSLCSWMSDAESVNQNWRGWCSENTTAHNAVEHGYVDGSGCSPNSLLRFTGGITSSSQSRWRPLSSSVNAANMASSASTTNFTPVFTG